SLREHGVLIMTWPVNTPALLDRLAALNVQIAGVTNTGNQPNDFFDRRDQLLDELSKLVKVTVTIAADGAAIVQIGSSLLVDRDRVHHLTSAIDSSGRLEIRWASEPGVPAISGGELEGLVRLYNETIPTYLERLDGVERDRLSRPLAHRDIVDDRLVVTGGHAQGCRKPKVWVFGVPLHRHTCAPDSLAVGQPRLQQPSIRSNQHHTGPWQGAKINGRHHAELHVCRHGLRTGHWHLGPLRLPLRALGWGLQTPQVNLLP
ncbi:MAG: hypothetical protein K6T31_06970, partial [Alicyclobacillus sp.]|nr:hypothetical protein [Alicyclobacillus sp.]